MQLIIGVIDDDIVSLFATTYCIEQSEVPSKVVTYETAEEALSAFETSVEEGEPLPDVLLLDLVMPGMDGWEFLSRLENIEQRLKDPEIYILSAFSNAKDRERAKQHPMIKGHFDKPLSKHNVEKMLLSRAR